MWSDQCMKLVIVGCGRVGSGLANSLSSEGHDIVVIDKSNRAFRRLDDGFPGQRIVGSGFDKDALTTAGASQADALAAVTSGDNSNILCARIARENYGIANVVARIYDPRRAEIYQRLGIPTVATVTWTIDQVRRWLLPDEDKASWIDATGTLQVIERPLPAIWAGRPLAGLTVPGRFTLISVTRGGSARLDCNELVGQDSDMLQFAVSTSAADELAELLEGGGR
jgi:trk system potassium uptake protein TrkA